MNPQRVTPKVDLAFKKIFGVEENKDLLISLINSIVSEKDQVADLTLLNPYNPQNFPNIYRLVYLFGAQIGLFLWTIRLNRRRIALGNLFKRVISQYDFWWMRITQIMELIYLSVQGTQPRHLKLANLMNNVLVLWNEQKERFGLKIIP